MATTRKPSEAARAAKARYREVHREELRERNARYREAHREELRLKQREYFAEHHEEILARYQPKPTTPERREYHRDRWLRRREQVQAERPPRPRSSGLLTIDALTEMELAYIAGLLDGEGCFRIAQFRNVRRSEAGSLMPRVEVLMSTAAEELLLWLAASLGTTVQAKPRRDRSPQRRDCLRVVLGGRRACRLAERLLPYLRVKQEQARLLVEFASTFQDVPYAVLDTDWEGKRLVLQARIRELNRRGPPR